MNILYIITILAVYILFILILRGCNKMKYKMKRIIKDDSKPIEEMGAKIIKPEKIIKASIDTEVSNEIWIYDERDTNLYNQN